MDFVKVVNSKLSVEEISELVSSPSCGATSLFVGTTRDNFDNKQVVQLEYEAYEPMAVKSMKKVCDDIRAKWKVENIAMFHRLGVVPVKEASVIIAVSSPHRAESLQAVQYAIDCLKSSTPIWKKEVYASAEPEWKENKECVWKSVDGVQNKIKLEPPEEVKESEGGDRNREGYCVAIEVSPHLIQINAGSEEITHRINSFIERKREQVNLGNIQDFCYHGNAPTTDGSCARVDALLVRRKDSKSHLRVRRVLNPWGPQTRGIDPGSMGCTNPQDPASALFQQHLKEESSKCGMKPEINDVKIGTMGIEERLSNAERHLNIHDPVPKDVYLRLKEIEDRILQLEGLSPEYFQFWKNTPFDKESQMERSPLKKRTYSTLELENKLLDLEFKLSVKRK